MNYIFLKEKPNKFLSLNSFLGVVSLFFLPFTALGGEGLLTYSVFSKTSITSHSSDYQGNTGALGAITLDHFLINGNLSSASKVGMKDGSVSGFINSPSVNLERASGRRRNTNSALVQAAAYEMDSLNMRLLALPDNKKSEWGKFKIQNNEIDKEIYGLKLSAELPVTVIDVSAEDFERAYNIFIDGDGLLLVRVHGGNVRFQSKGVHVGAGVRPENIVFFFPEARSLELSHSGGAIDPKSSKSWGIPGTIFAPNSLVFFSEILVTGQLLVGQICTRDDVNGGQVNAAFSTLLGQMSQGCGASNQKNCQ